MGSDYQDFKSGKVNYYRSGTLSIGRERIPGKKSDYYIIKNGDEIVHDWFGILGKKTGEKKTMGGKAPYVMVMTEKIGEMVREGKATTDQLGCLAVLSANIEWGTGRLIKKRSKKSMQANDIQEVLGISHGTWAKKVKELKDNSLMTVNKDGYFISTDLFKKGEPK